MLGKYDGDCVERHDVRGGYCEKEDNRILAGEEYECGLDKANAGENIYKLIVIVTNYPA